jgi:predicted dehydrogenase
MDKVRIAIIGAGTWGENHALIYNAHPFAQTVAICDTNVDRARAVANRVGVPIVYDDYTRMLDEIECDAVSVITPDFAHTGPAIAAANRKKHILIEKPIATSREDTFRILEAVEKNGVRAMVDLHNRWSPPFNAAWQAIGRGEIGSPISAYFRLNDAKWVATDMLSWAAKSSILWFLGSHSLDTLCWFFSSRPKRVYSIATDGVLKKLGVDVVDQYLTTLEFENSCVAQMENGWITPNANPNVNDMKFTILGDKGMISMDLSNHNMMQHYTEQQVHIPDVIVQNTVFGQPKGFAFESIRSFVDCLVSGEEFHVSLRDAAITTLALLAVMQSAETHMPVEIDYGPLK